MPNRDAIFNRLSISTSILEPRAGFSEAFSIHSFDVQNLSLNGRLFSQTSRLGDGNDKRYDEREGIWKF